MRYLLLCLFFGINYSLSAQSTWKTYPAFGGEYAYQLLAGHEYSDLWLVYKSAEDDTLSLRRYNIHQEPVEEHAILSEAGLQLIQATRDRDRLLVLLGNQTRADWHWLVFYITSGRQKVIKTSAYPQRAIRQMALVEESVYYGLDISNETTFYCLDFTNGQIRTLEYPPLRKPVFQHFQADPWSGELHLSWRELNPRSPTSVVVHSYRSGKLSRQLSLEKGEKNFKNASLLRNSQGDLFMLGSYALDISRRSVQGSFWANVSSNAQLASFTWFDFGELAGHPQANRKERSKNKKRAKLITTPSFMQRPFRFEDRLYQVHIAFRPRLQEQYQGSTRPSSFVFEAWDLDYASILQFNGQGELTQNVSVKLLDLVIPEFEDILSFSAQGDTLRVAYPRQDRIVWQDIFPGTPSSWHVWPIPSLSKKAVLHRRVKVEGLRGGYFAASGYQILHRGKKYFWWKVILPQHP